MRKNLTQSSRFLIVGAGVSGLTLGYKLKQRYPEATIKILESSHRPGGWLQTISKDGFLFEMGPRSFRSKGPGIQTLQLIESLGLEKDLIFADPEAKKRYLYQKGRLEPIPTNLLSFFKSPLTPKIFKALCKDFWASPASLEDETISDFVTRRLGRECADLFFDPLISGIFAGDISQLSVRSCFPWLFEAEKQHGSLWKALLTKVPKRTGSLSPFVAQSLQKGLFTLKNGLQSLVGCLAKNLEKELIFNAPVKKVLFQGRQAYVELTNGESLDADQLFFAIPPHSLRQVWQSTNLQMISLLEKIPTASIVAVNLGYQSSVLKKKGFGYLIPSSEKQNLLGVVWDSSAFPQQNQSPNQTRLTAMLGGVHHPSLLDLKDDALLKIVLEEIEKHLGISFKPDSIHIHRAYQAIPQYGLGHHQLVRKIENELHASNVTFLGNGFYGISVSDCIAKAMKIAEFS